MLAGDNLILYSDASMIPLSVFVWIYMISISSFMKEGFLKLLIEKLNVSPFEHFTQGGAIVKTNCPIVFYDLVHDRSCPADMHCILSVSY